MSDLGFTYRTRKNKDLEILHRGRLASTLRGHEAEDFLAETESESENDAQQLMARITANYKHGNERLASQHPRNRRQKRRAGGLTGRSAGGATAGHLARAALFVYPAPRGQGSLPRPLGYLYVSRPCNSSAARMNADAPE